MEPLEIKGMKLKISLEYKGGFKEIEETMPHVSEHQDYAIQYVGIWRVIFDKVNELQAKSVLEFGTREGYSTRLFSKALERFDGRIVTVDINPPKTEFTENNITAITKPVEEFEGFNCDILYIDDWHNGHHLYWELNEFSKFAKVIMIHDVCLDKELMGAVEEWCRHNMMIYTIYPVNGCGLAVIEVEKSRLFYKNTI